MSNLNDLGLDFLSDNEFANPSDNENPDEATNPSDDNDNNRNVAANAPDTANQDVNPSSTANLEDDNGENPSIITGQYLDSVSFLKEYIEDDSMVPPAKRMTYIFMLCHQNVEGFNPHVNLPYSSFIDRTGYKKQFKYPKTMIVQELKRRDPSVRLNVSNISITLLMARLGPLERESDRQYIIEKEREYRGQFSRQLREEQEDIEDNGPAARMTPADRMRFALLMEIEEMYQEYLLSQNCLTRSEIDAGQTGAGGRFWERGIPVLNSDEWQPESEALPDLHSEFATRRRWPRSGYVWTVEKGKKFVNDLRRNLTDTISRYERSGNGANQATHDDSDNEIDEAEENWGRFDAVRARRVAERRGDTSNGDDRASFIRNLPVDFLFTWHLFDKRNLLRFTCAQLSESHSASSHATPSPTARARTNRNNNEQLMQTQREMVTTVRTIGASIADMSRANADIGRAAKIRRIDELRAERYRVALARASAANEDEEEVHDKYIEELSVQIHEASNEVYGTGDEQTTHGNHGTPGPNAISATAASPSN